MSLHPTLFALEDTSAQFTWRGSASGPLNVRCGAFEHTFVLDGGPGACTITGLEPDTAYIATFQQQRGRSTTIRFETLKSPLGEEVYRFATMNDLHLGRTHFGLRKSMTEDLATDLHPIRCAQAAAAELTAWGAERLIIKGDLVDSSSPHCWALAHKLLSDITIPVSIIPGNHEMAHGSVDARAHAKLHGIEMVSEVETLDIPGLRLLLMDSTVSGIDVGRWSLHREAVADAASEAEGAAMLLTHHQPQRAPLPTYFPAGISSVVANKFLRTLARANPATFGSSGHTHRHRRHVIAGIPWTEIGSTKDFPGTWAGYVVHEHGIRQVVRRVERTDCLEWLDRTRLAVGGIWSLWSPGSIDQRCFTHDWPTRAR